MLKLWHYATISYPESSGSLISEVVARRDCWIFFFILREREIPVLVHMLKFKTEKGRDGNQSFLLYLHHTFATQTKRSIWRISELLSRILEIFEIILEF